MDFSTDTGASPNDEFGRAIEGDFETHVTVRADRPDTIASLGAWAAAHGLKLTHIVLDRGRTPSQPMLTLHGTGSLDEQRRTAEQCVERLARAGFTVVRTKIEAAPWNAGVPQTDAEAATLPAHCHFEHHIKLRLPIPYDTKRLTAVVEGHSAHISRNARRVLSGGVQERFVTQRARGSAGRWRVPGWTRSSTDSSRPVSSLWTSRRSSSSMTTTRPWTVAGSRSRLPRQAVDG